MDNITPPYLPKDVIAEFATYEEAIARLNEIVRAQIEEEVEKSLGSQELDPALIEHLLLHATLSRTLKRSITYSKARLKPASKFSFMSGYHGINAQEYILDVKPTDLSRPFDHALIMPFDDGNFMLEHIYKIPRRELRGLPFNLYPIRYEAGVCTTAEETIQQWGLIFFYTPSDRWVEGPLNTSPSTRVTAPKRWAQAGTAHHNDLRFYSHTCTYPPQADQNFRIALHLGLQFCERYDWYVLIGFEDLPKLQVFVNPHSVRQLFEIKKVIDPIEGRKRLVHWVKSHNRLRASNRSQTEENLEDWIKVCEHLRGCYEFEWKGLNCWLIPSEFDRERLKLHTKHAEIWK